MLDDGVYKRVWNVVFRTYDDNIYEYQVTDGHIVEPPNASRTGYDFLRWVSKKTWNQNTEITDDMELIAEYRRSVFTVFADADGGSNSLDTTMNYGQVISQLLTERTGNTFVNWIYTVDYLEHHAGDIVTFPLTITDDLYIKAIWNVDVTFISAGDVYSASTIRSGTTISQPNDPSRTGYNFDYWTLDNQQFNFSNVINQDTTLVAKYTVITYNITYTMNGGNQPSRTSYTVEDTPFTIPSVSRSNYEFDGWSGTDISSYVNTITITSSTLGDKSYTANFTRLWTVTFQSNGSTYTTRNARNNEAVSLPSNPSVAGKQFNYWTLNDVQYTDQAITSNVTLVAYLTDIVCNVDVYGYNNRDHYYKQVKYGEKLGTFEYTSGGNTYQLDMNYYNDYWYDKDSYIYNDLVLTLVSPVTIKLFKSNTYPSNGQAIEDHYVTALEGRLRLGTPVAPMPDVDGTLGNLFYITSNNYISYETRGNSTTRYTTLLDEWNVTVTLNSSHSMFNRVGFYGCRQYGRNDNYGYFAVKLYDYNNSLLRTLTTDSPIPFQFELLDSVKRLTSKKVILSYTGSTYRNNDFDDMYILARIIW